MIEKIVFNVFAFTLFILIFMQLIRKNDTSYVYLLIAQFIGITINFIELSVGKSFGIVMKIIMYLLFQKNIAGVIGVMMIKKEML